MPNYLTQEDVQNYGTDMVDFAQRAAAHAMAPHLQELNRQNAELQQQLAHEAKQRIDRELDAAVPGWRETNRDPRWLQWLQSRPFIRAT